MKNSDLSFLREVAAPVAVKESSLTELTDSFVAYATKPLGSIKIAALKREDFADKPEILEKFFKNENVELDRFYIPQLSAKEYEALVGDPKKLKNPANAKLETATDYYIKKMRLAKVAKALNCSVKQLDLTDYIWDDRYYIRYNLVDNMRVVDDWYRDQGKDSRYSSTSYDAYITNDPRTAILDTKLYDELYTFCITAIRQRKCMLLGKVDKCLSILRNIAEYTNGFVDNPTKQMLASMQSYKKYFETLLKDATFAEWLKSNNDITVYGNSELTHSDYVDTYKTIIRALVSGNDEDIRSLSDLLDGVEDPYLEEIYENRPELCFQSWQLDKAD